MQHKRDGGEEGARPLCAALCAAARRAERRAPSSRSAHSAAQVTRPLSSEDSGAWVPVVCFECRGCEPTRWTPGDGFVVKAAGGAVFEDADLSDEWTEYDEKLGESCSIMELQSKLEVLREKK